MDVKMILPALLGAKDPGFRPIKYALFPPLGLAALAGYLRDDDHVVLQDEHVMPLDLDDRPDLVVLSVYITSARRRSQCPNSVVVSRGCPHHCDFCYKDAFYRGGRSFYTQAVDAALAEIERL